MPSPFPGMDPYLEGDDWTSFHAYFATEIARQLTPTMHVWPIALTNSLPTIPVPLLAGDPDVALEMQAALQNVYDLGGFDLVLDYSKAPAVPLRGEQAVWATERLRARRASS